LEGVRGIWWETVLSNVVKNHLEVEFLRQATITVQVLKLVDGTVNFPFSFQSLFSKIELKLASFMSDA
jgi:hypothetical protein